MDLTRENKASILFYIIASMMFALAMIMSYQVGYSQGVEDQRRESQNDQTLLSEYYMSEGYTPEIAKHLANVELRIIPKDSLYIIIKED